jgi:hypothetical protein
MLNGPAHPDVLRVLDGLDASARPVHEARVLPPEAYMSEAFFAFEKEAVFMHSWLCVGRVQQLPNPGDFLTGELPEGEQDEADDGRGDGAHEPVALDQLHAGHPAPRLAIEASVSSADRRRQRSAKRALLRKASPRGCGSSTTNSPKTRPGFDAMAMMRVERNTAS